MIWDRYAAYLARPPELTVSWADPETDARGWLVINSLRGGAAGGGTRMRPGVDVSEVTYLAKAMELKFCIAGPEIGGAKSGIDFDPDDPRKPAVLERWYRAIRPQLVECYGTAGDLNVDEVAEVIPTVRRLGLRHPQQGIVKGHLGGRVSVDDVVAVLDAAGGLPLNGRHGAEGMSLTLADMITGWGVAESVRHAYARRGESLEGVRVLLEGFGNVGGACGLYLARAGALVVGITDAEKALVDPTGIDADGMEALLRRRRRGLLPRDDERATSAGDRSAFWSTPADVFVCAALSESVDEGVMDALGAAGVGVIACGANHPFREDGLTGTRVQRLADERFTVVPDIVSNCGRARAFGYAMEPGAKAEEEPIFDTVSQRIGAWVAAAADRAGDGRTGLLAATYDLALDRIGAP